MLETIDKNRALQAAERLQSKLKERGDVANEDKLSLLKSVLQSPLFSQILNLQTSLQQLKDQVGWHHPQRPSRCSKDLVRKGSCFSTG
nr:unnamed protein product [Mus musculus]